MLKKGIYLFAILLIAFQCFAAQNMDIKTRQLLAIIQQAQLKKSNLAAFQEPAADLLKPFYVHRSPDAKLMVKAFVKINPGKFDRVLFQAERIKINSEHENILSVRIPLSALPSLAEAEGIQWVELARKAKFRLDVSRVEIKANLVHQGVSEAGRAFTGKDVIIGMVDSGIDFTHPDFKNADGTTRIISIWDQLTEAGSHPSGYSYGTEWTSNQINNNQCSHADIVAHGTHVMGTAAGNGAGSNNFEYKGIAPEADIIAVANGGMTTDIADGVQYIFNRAQALNRPAVVNLSLGVHEGPHDGTSLLDETIDNLTGAGKIVVGAAGNEGEQYLHVHHNLTGDSIFTCFAEPEDSLADFNYIDLWGEESANLAVAVLAVDQAGNISFYRSSNKRNVSRKYFIVNSDTIGSVRIGYQKSSLNNSPHYLFLYDLNPYANEYHWFLRVSGTGEFDAWTEYNPSHIHFKPSRPANFPHQAQLYLPGDNDKSVGEIGGTAKSIVSVGAYTTKNEWVNYEGYTYRYNPVIPVGEIAPFSSHGPTRDGRLKPEISAPGNIISSPLSSTANPDKVESARIVHLPNAPQLSSGYVLYEGTSMAAPHITGVVALMLEANASLTPDDVKVLLERNARKDSYTSGSANYVWGHGKVESYYSVKNAAAYAAVPQKSGSSAPAAFRLHTNFPNPFNAETLIRFELPHGGKVALQLYDCLGRDLGNIFQHHLEAGVHELKFNAADLPSGVYFYRLNLNGEFTQINKMVLLK